MSKTAPFSKKHLCLLFVFFPLAVILFFLQILALHDVSDVKGHFVSTVAAGALPATGGEQIPNPVLVVPYPNPVSVPEFSVTNQESAVPSGQQPPAESVKQQGVIYSVPGAGQKIALTFDDGPSLELTASYLKILRDEGVQATFFVLGSNVKRYPGLVAMISQEGHEIGNHTYSHSNLKLLSESAIIQDVSIAADLIAEEIPQRITLFRPPGGNINQAVTKTIDGMEMSTVLWNIDPRDWKTGAPPKKIVDHIIGHLKPGAIVVLHEGKPQTLAALPELLRVLRQQDWQMVTVSELLASEQALQ